MLPVMVSLAMVNRDSNDSKLGRRTFPARGADSNNEGHIEFSWLAVRKRYTKRTEARRRRCARRLWISRKLLVPLHRSLTRLTAVARRSTVYPRAGARAGILATAVCGCGDSNKQFIFGLEGSQKIATQAAEMCEPMLGRASSGSVSTMQLGN